MGRPPLEIDSNQVIQLARIGCTYDEMAAIIGCDRKTLMRRFGTAVKEGQQYLKGSLRRMQYRSAQNGNVSMQIWLGKQLLEQKDSALLDQSRHISVTINNHIPQEEKVGSHNRNIQASA